MQAHIAMPAINGKAEFNEYMNPEAAAEHV